MEKQETTSEDTRSLRRALRGVIALSTLPGQWSAYTPGAIVQSPAQVLLKTLSLDLIYLRVGRLQEAGASRLPAVVTVLPMRSRRSAASRRGRRGRSGSGMAQPASGRSSYRRGRPAGSACRAMSGYEAAQTLRQRAEPNGTLLVALTGYGQEED